MFTARFLPLLIVLALVVSACMPVQPEVNQLPTTGLRSDAPEYAKHGPHWVGYMPLVIDEGTSQSLDAGIWYPALNPNGAEEAIVYPFIPKMPEMGGGGAPIILGSALRDAPFDTANGPYPLVIFSHGFGLTAAAYHTLPEHYASHGFIVIAPEHLEDDWMNNMATTLDRPGDIVQTLDTAEQLNAADGALAGLLDLENVAVVGHSFGGYTALALAGAQFNIDSFNARCAELQPDDPEMFLCAPLLGKEADMAAYAGLDSVPEGLWPSMGDPRVSAIIPMAGDAYLFGEQGLAEITIPMMAIGGTADTGSPFDWGSELTYDSASSEYKSLVALEGAEHMVMGSPCDTMPWTKDHWFQEFLCSDPVWDKERALDLVHHFSTAFLLDNLKGDIDARAALLPQAVQFPGIDYVTTLEQGSDESAAVTE